MYIADDKPLPYRYSAMEGGGWITAQHCIERRSTHTTTTFSTLGNVVMHLDDRTMIPQTEGTTFGDLQSRLHCHVVIWKR